MDDEKLDDLKNRLEKVEETWESPSWDDSMDMSYDDMISSGMLWYINRVALHPLGLALGISRAGRLMGCQLLTVPDEPTTFGLQTDKEKFLAWEKFKRQINQGGHNPDVTPEETAELIRATREEREKELNKLHEEIITDITVTDDGKGKT